MLDGMARRLIDPPLALMAGHCIRLGLGADAITGLALCFGVASAAAIAAGDFGLGLVLMALGRLGDGLDGAVARQTRRTDLGGFLDIVSDFVFYGAVPLAFAFVAPDANALVAATLLFSFYVNGATFLAYATVAGQRGLQTTSRGLKSIYFTAGLAEGAETIGFFALMMLFPQAFPTLAVIFSLMCLVTAASRVLLAWRTFR